MADTDQEKTEAATPRRLEEARKKGQVPRSRELNVLASLLVSGFALLVLGPMMLAGIRKMLVRGLSFDHNLAYDTFAMGEELMSAAYATMLLIAPFFLLMCAVSLLSPIALGGWLFVGDMAMPKFSRINPASGLVRMFSVKSLVELGKAIAKFLLVAVVVVMILGSILEDIITLPLLELEISLDHTAHLLIKSFLGFSVVLLIVVMIDVPYQLWDYQKQVKMTKQEIREEMKDTEGRPEVKMAIRAKQQEIAQRRMMEEVPKADVIITNPTHYAVALKYDQSGSGAPIVVAKGKDLIAAKIREIAKENKIVIFSAPPLARALYRSTDLNQQIPENLFVAVAQVLAYIFQLRQAATSSRVIPQPPANIPVPVEYTLQEQL
ncbi:MAG: flagellar biosynthesis protein FlhB [Pseudomonadota bacterium]